MQLSCDTAFLQNYDEFIYRTETLLTGQDGIEPGRERAVLFALRGTLNEDVALIPASVKAPSGIGGATTIKAIKNANFRNPNA